MEEMQTHMASLDGIKAQLKLAADEVGRLETRIAKTRGELEKLDEMRRQILASLG